jgi:hypothetical protein
VIEGDGMSWDDRTLFARRTVDQCLQNASVNVGRVVKPQPTYALIVYYLDDGSQLSIVFPALDDHDSADFNEFPPCRFDVDSGHNDESTAVIMLVLTTLQEKQSSMRSQIPGRC